MAESPEHQFLSQMIVDYLERAASTQLYSFLENQRKTFDFGCVLLRDWTRPVIGQTQVADHITPLVKEWYETGAINLQRMKAIDAVQAECPTCSAAQGGRLSWYSRSMRQCKSGQ